ITQNNSYIDSTIIDGNQNGSVVTFESGEDTTAVLCGFTIQNGTGTYYLQAQRGGGIFCKYADPNIKRCVIKNNTGASGAGLECYNASINLIGVTICYNHAFGAGGGILLRENSTANFNSSNRCNIYENYAGNGSDLYSLESPPLDIIVDTFTVMEPTIDFIAGYPSNIYTIDILHARIEPINKDLYVSPEGDNTNSGLTSAEPLKNISYALLKVASDSTNPNTIHLANGYYSPSLTSEKFNLNCRSYVSLIGEGEESTILDAEDLSSLIKCIFGDSYFSIENLTLQNGNSRIGGAMYISNNSNPIIKNVTIKDNLADMGTSIFCQYYCNPIFDNVKIKGDPSMLLDDEPISIYSNSNPVFINCIIEDNNINPEESGFGAISCVAQSNPILINTKIVNNNDFETSGIGVYNGFYDKGPILINCTICDNSNCSKGVINQTWRTNVTLINCILRNPAEDEIWFYYQGDPNTVTISYTNIEDSIYAINTNNNGTIKWLEGNIDEDPIFVDTLNNNYQLLQGSPCIDAGTPDTTGLNLPPYDLAGNPRIFNDTIDMGAYEWQGQGIDEPDTSFINKLYLFQNKPNPFSSSTTITFISADYERIKDYKLSIYNARGQLIKTYNGKRDNFWVKTDIVWDGTDEDGKKVPSGVYFYKLLYRNNAVTRKMILVR
ncbi:MAG: choice-of-anchor Q domain-containing protein, partial [Candidatus Cloacimonadota bacterium]|nr:choice-of-anchor Q domain-containing protein [Candidatus Cloacimonadota bacterium]